MKALFFGTPEIAVPALDALTEVADVAGVVCQPDRPAGRGMKLRPPAVKVRAFELGIPVYQPVKVRTGELLAWIKEKDVDVALVIAYGRILPTDVLEAPRLGCVNLHASLLPAYRGAAPIQRVLMDGQTTTGVCLMQMDAGMDTGDILACQQLPILEEENAGELAVRLGSLAADVVREQLPRLHRGELVPVAQDHTKATYAPPITREDGIIDFARSAESICHQVRGLAPRPGATAQLCHPDGSSKRFRLVAAHPCPAVVPLAPGQIGVDGSRLLVGTGQGLLEVVTGQIEGKKALPARDLVNGRTVGEGDILK